MADIVKVGDYIILQRQSYTKLHKVTAQGTVMLGKDHLKIGAIIGKPVWATYKMEPKKKAKRDFVLTKCDVTVSVSDQITKDVSSGIDNRNIFDDGNSQQLSTQEIIGMRDSGMSGHDIVGQLVENSKTFRDKTEYSQAKYLKKKEKKYFEYVTIRRPTLRLVAEIMYRQDPAKIMGLRMDTLAQLTTTVGISSQGTYVLYESGCQGLVAATMLNSMGEGGWLVHAHAGNLPQKQAILAMNFGHAQLARLVSVNIYSLLRKLFQEGEEESKRNENILNKENSFDTLNKDNCEVSGKESSFREESLSSADVEQKLKTEQQEQSTDTEIVDKDRNDEIVVEDAPEATMSKNNDKKRKWPEEGESVSKRPRWELDTERAADLLRPRKIDGLVVVSREHPANIVAALLPFVAPSRPIVVFCLFREPLLELYLQLKARSDVIALRLTETWLRTHQVLPNRTHPDILMSGGGGYLLTGTVVEQ